MENTEWQALLSSRANAIRTTHMQILTLGKLQIVINLLLGLAAITGLIVSAVFEGTLGTVLTIISIVLIIVFLVYNFTISTVAPTNILQYACVERGKTYVFQVLSKKRSVFTDGTACIETEKKEPKHIKSLYFARCGYDYFANMTEIERTTEVHRKTGKQFEKFTGVICENGKRYMCSIAFDGETPVYGKVGGARVKYFNVNSVKPKFLVPTELMLAVKAEGVPFPKLPGVLIRDDITK